MNSFAAVLVIVVAASLLWWWQRQNAGWLRRARQNKMRELLPLLDGGSFVDRPGDFPAVAGGYGGHEALIELITDSIAVRKLPALWLIITIKAALPTAGAFGVMNRPQNTEYWSPFDRLPDHLPKPAHWSVPANLRARGAEGPRLAAYVEPHLDFLGSVGSKEILIMPGGVRMTMLAEEGDRASYLVGRQEVFSSDPVAATAALDMLRRCNAIIGRVRQSAGQGDADGKS